MTIFISLILQIKYNLLIRKMCISIELYNDLSRLVRISFGTIVDYKMPILLIELLCRGDARWKIIRSKNDMWTIQAKK